MSTRVADITSGYDPIEAKKFARRVRKPNFAKLAARLLALWDKTKDAIKIQKLAHHIYGTDLSNYAYAKTGSYIDSEGYLKYPDGINSYRENNKILKSLHGQMKKSLEDMIQERVQNHPETQNDMISFYHSGFFRGIMGFYDQFRHARKQSPQRRRASQMVDNDIRTTLSDAALVFGKDSFIGRQAAMLLRKTKQSSFEVSFDLPRFKSGDDLRVASMLSKAIDLEVNDPRVVGDSQSGKWVFSTTVTGKDEITIRFAVEKFMRRNGAQDPDSLRLTVQEI